MISLEKQISDVAEGLKDVVTKSELADMMNSFVSDDDEKWLMFNAKFSSADEVYESIYRQAKSSIYVVDNYIGLRTLVHLKNSPTGVNIILFSDNVGNNRLHNIESVSYTHLDVYKRQFIGYCLIPSNKGQRMMVIKGNGGEGKSQIGAVLSTIFGTNMKDGSIGKISENRFARADLEHILLCVDDDMRMEALRQTNLSLIHI